MLLYIEHVAWEVCASSLCNWNLLFQNAGFFEPIYKVKSKPDIWDSRSVWICDAVCMWRKMQYIQRLEMWNRIIIVIWTKSLERNKSTPHQTSLESNSGNMFAKEAEEPKQDENNFCIEIQCGN